LNVRIVRNPTKQICIFQSHFKNFENLESVQQIFEGNAHSALSNLEIEFTNLTSYMSVDYEGRLLINPKYFETGDFTDLYLDVIHELVHVKQVMEGKNCNKSLPYVKRPLEVEAYKAAVDEARALGLDDKRIIDYLESDLITAEELKQLAIALGIEFSEDRN
jgi:hypothetical protein